MALKLIIADDAPFIREVLRHLLQGSEFELVGEAQNGEEARDLALKHRPDLILMDLVMPQKNGIEATQEILEEWPDARIVACSTLDHENMVDKALEAGCLRYVKKPFDAEEMFATLRALSP